VEELNIQLAAEIMRRQAADPLRHSAWIVENVELLRAQTRGELDTPINQKFQLHPLVMQALSLAPTPNPMDVPIGRYGAFLAAGTLDCSWPRRRKQIIAAAESNPPPRAA